MKNFIWSPLVILQDGKWKTVHSFLIFMNCNIHVSSQNITKIQNSRGNHMRTSIFLQKSTRGTIWIFRLKKIIRGTISKFPFFEKNYKGSPYEIFHFIILGRFLQKYFYRWPPPYFSKKSVEGGVICSYMGWLSKMCSWNSLEVFSYL